MNVASHPLSPSHPGLSRPTKRPRARRLIQAGVLSATLASLAVTAQSPSVRREPGLGAASDAPRLIELLGQSGSSLADKTRACQQLAIVGGRDAVPVLAGHLTDPVLGSYARSALESIPDEAAGDALRAALGKLEGQALGGVIQSLAHRRDIRSVATLTALVHQPSRGVGDQALLALGRIGSPEAQQTVRDVLANGPAQLRTAAAESAILLGEAELSAGRAGRAMAFFDSVREADVPGPLVLAATRGSILARGSTGLPLLLRQWRSDAPPFLALAARVSRDLPGTEVSRGLSQALAELPVPAQPLLIQALADRGDPVAREAIEQTAGSPDPAVRLASLAALGTLGGQSSVSILLRSLGPDINTEEVSVAMDSLYRVSSGDANAAIIHALETAPPAARARMLTVLGHRRAHIATDAVLKHAGDPQVDVRRAAIDALASVAQAKDLPNVVRVCLANRDDALREKTEHAIYAVGMKDTNSTRRGQVLAAAFREARGAAEKGSLMEVAAMFADAQGYDLVAAGYRESDAALRDGALRLLSHWPDATPAPFLLEVFKTTPNPVHRTLALRGIVTLGTLWTEASPRTPAGTTATRPPPAALKWMSETKAALRNDPEEKRTLLSGLASFSCGEGLSLIEPFLSDPAVQRDAESAYLQAAKGLTQADEARTARRIAEAIASRTQDAEIRQRASESLKKLNDIAGGN